MIAINNVTVAFGLSSGLFYLGVAVGYLLVLPVCLMFFMNSPWWGKTVPVNRP